MSSNWTESRFKLWLCYGYQLEHNYGRGQRPCSPAFIRSRHAWSVAPLPAITTINSPLQGNSEHAWMLALSLVGRGLISFVDNVFHYGAPLDQPRYARNLALPDLGPRACSFISTCMAPTINTPALPGGSCPTIKARAA